MNTNLPPFPSLGAEYIRCRRRCDLPGMVYRLRRTFLLETVPDRCVLRLAGFTRHDVCVNGQRVGRGPLVAGRYCATYDLMDVRDLLRAGRNVIAVQLMTGHYHARFLDPATWIGGGIRGDLCAGDGRVLLVSDGSWKCDLDRAYGFRRPRRSVWSPIFEDFDARRDEPGWREVDFDDGHWPDCRFGDPEPTVREFEPNPIGTFDLETDEAFRFASAGRVRWLRDPEEYYWLGDEAAYEALGDVAEGITDLLVPGDRFRPVTVEARPDESVFFRVIADRYVLGRPFFEIEADEGVQIDIVWAERKFNGDPLLSPGGRMANWATYTTRAGAQRFMFFDVHGFREIQFTLRPGRGKVAFKRVGAERQWTMRCENGSLHTSDEDYDRLWRAGARTVACITTDHHSDNSFREQAPWSGDQEWTKMGAYVSEGVHPITERQLRQILKGQTRDGRICSPYPHPFPYLRMCDAQHQDSTGVDLPDHSLGYIISLGRHYLYSGNRDLIAEAWPHLERQIAYFDTVLDGRGLIDLRRIVDSWIWVDWRGLKDRTAPMNALWGGALATMIRFAGVLERDAAPYQERYARLRRAFIDTFWDSGRNLFIDLPLARPELGENVSQLTQAIAACFDLLPDACDRARLADDLTVLDGRLGIATPPMQGFVFRSLEKLGAEEAVHRILRKQWLYPEMFENGTIPEFWPGQLGSVYAICQGGGPMISWAITWYVLGVRPVEPGFRRFVVKPVPGDLDLAEGVHPTVRGPIRVAWRRAAEGLVVDVDAPEGCEYEVLV